MSLGENIKNARKNKKITQNELATNLNVTTRTIQNYESNNRTPSIEILNKIAEYLSVNIADLIANNNKIRINKDGVPTINLNLMTETERRNFLINENFYEQFLTLENVNARKSLIPKLKLIVSQTEKCKKVRNNILSLINDISKENAETNLQSKILFENIFDLINNYDTVLDSWYDIFKLENDIIKNLDEKINFIKNAFNDIDDENQK
ncbi:helix-turn-helix domain-containing protein [uncultured Clostridium sp.]|uniref:helix-turn-helix domain-containing protein n=1 Tax=uncultured Clostridium sp. TaxID=59620 RepID=UPI002587ADD8|nr:helix-turn-helix transcriptional regulator [uncultured Clostridium sp.]